ncbi:30S ribosomal protein S2 [Candidatus Microgenomates bacterium]|nr:30S ribosomal protein S2 [Candidatus Microgenomates bacterium]
MQVILDKQSLSLTDARDKQSLSLTDARDRMLDMATKKKVSPEGRVLQVPREEKQEETKARGSLDVTLEELLEAGAHFGHRADRWHPKSAPYLFGVREGVHIFDLEKTRDALLAAQEELKSRAEKGQTFLFVGTKQQAQEVMRKTAQELDMPYIVDRWIGGFFTNFEQMKRSLSKLAKMKQEQEAGEYKKFTKKEQLLLSREISHLERLFGGVATVTKLPDMVIIVDTNREKTAVEEARKMGVPILAIVDSNSDPTLVDYPIPANDDSIKSVEYIVGKLGQAIAEGKKKAKIKDQKSKLEEKVEQAPVAA